MLSRFTRCALLFPLGITFAAALTGCSSTSGDDAIDAGPRDGGPVIDGAPDVDGGNNMSQVVVCPRTISSAAGTCVIKTPGTAGLMFQGTVLAPGQVFENGQLLIGADGLIKCAACDCGATAGASTATVLDCAETVISPGLINAHDHITFTNTPPHPPQTRRYAHRHEWRGACPNDAAQELKTLGTAKARQVAWGELRQMLAGTTSVVGSGDADNFLRNLDRAVDRQEGLSQPPAQFETFPLGDGSSCTRLQSGCGYPKVPTTASVTADAYVPHVSEGITVEARNEFTCLSAESGGGHDHVNGKSAFIHSIGLTATDVDQMRNDGTIVVWSPRSNIDLYGNTAQVTMMDRMGAVIALGTDWVASGSLNILRELHCADSLNKSYYGGYFSDEQLWQMATVNAARAAKMDDAIGALRAGLVADVSIFRTQGTRKHHRAVLDAGAEDVVLVLRGGTVMNGDAALVAALDPAGAACDMLDVCGAQKRVCVMREAGISLADLTTMAAAAPGTLAIEPLFYCGTPTNEPSCKPSRPGEYSGDITTDDPDGDGVLAGDNCPRVFNPVRPMDAGKQPDADMDGVGDVCDPCPLDANTSTCTRPDPNDVDRDGVPMATDNCPTVANPNQADRDTDNIGDACDACPDFSNLNGAACGTTIAQLRDPALGRRSLGQRVTISVAHVTAVKSNGFYIRDAGGRDYAGIFLFMNPVRQVGGMTVVPGMILSVTGRFTEFSNIDQIDQTAVADVTLVAATGGNTTPVDATTLELGSAASGEKLESLLVRVRNVTVQAKVAGDDDFYVTDTPSTQNCTGTAPPCARVSDFLIDNATNGTPASTVGQTFSQILGLIDGYAMRPNLMLRTAGDLTP